MTIQLSFKGYNFSLNTPEVEGWINANIPLRDSIINERTHPGYQPDLTVALSDTKPFIKLNTLNYPTGASRWATFYGLMTGKEIDAISADPFTDTSGTLRMEQDGKVISTTMYILPAIPLAEWGADKNGYGELDSVQESAKCLYLVRLVDERYYWQHDTVLFEVSDSGSNQTWTNAITAIASQLSITLSTSTVSSDYGKICLDSDLFNINFGMTSSLALDAVLTNVGMVLARKLDGTYLAYNADDALTAETGNYSGELRCGGIWERATWADTLLPSEVNFVFPTWADDWKCYSQQDGSEDRHIQSPLTGKEWYKSTVSTSSVSDYTGLNFTKNIRDTAKAIYTNHSDLSPSNSAALSALATKWWGDWVKRVAYTDTDEVFNSLVVPTSISGLYNWEWEFSAYDCHTRITSDYHSLNVEMLCHETSAYNEPMICDNSTIEEYYDFLHGSATLVGSTYHIQKDRFHLRCRKFCYSETQPDLELDIGTIASTVASTVVTNILGSAGGTSVNWAKAQSDYEANSGQPRVSVKSCDKAGTETGAAYYVYLPKLQDQTSVVKTNDILLVGNTTSNDKAVLTDRQIGFLKGTLSGSLVSLGSANASLTADGTNYSTIAVWDFLLASGQSIASGKKIFATYMTMENRWYVTGAEC